MYQIKLEPKQLADLWRLREFCAGGPIAKQVRMAIDAYLKNAEKEIGTTIEDVADAIQTHERELADKRR